MEDDLEAITDASQAAIADVTRVARNLVRAIRKHAPVVMHHIKPATRVWIKEQDRIEAQRKKEKKKVKKERKLVMLGDEG